MSAFAFRDHAAATPARSGPAALDWTAQATGLDAAEAAWRALEEHGHVTPYQRFDWVSAFARHAMDGAALRVVTFRASCGRPMAVLPFALWRWRGITLAAFVGGKHANFHMGVYAKGAMAGLTAADARAMLEACARALGGVDAFMLTNQPVAWDGARNPLALLEARPSPSQAFKLALSGDGDATIRKAMSRHARKKHKTKRARFLEMGPSRHFIARSDADKERILEAFLRQKSQRFSAMGVHDPFQHPGIRAFLRCASGLDGQAEALELAALELNGVLIATYVGAVSQGRFSGMATSFEPDPGVIKVSPGELLLVDLIRQQCAAGRSCFDLGVGEARYKTTICEQTEELVDSFVAMSGRGQIVAAVLRLAQRAKGAVKRSPRLHALAMRVSQLRRLFTPRPAGASQA
jgi:CelD/BcsL family acetyltransferase involved in cellulose biosynthesis